MESYAHKAAKSVFTQWLREEAERASPGGGFANFLGIHWRVNRGAPHWGIWEEYPVLHDGTGLAPVWDEMGWHRPDLPPDIGNERPPTYEELKARSMIPTAILDIAIQHKGTIISGVEIVHKHAPDEHKLAFLDWRGIHKVLVIPAKWVLGQIDKPRRIPEEFWRHM
jgi:hypothetical protein